MIIVQNDYVSINALLCFIYLFTKSNKIFMKTCLNGIHYCGPPFAAHGPPDFGFNDVDPLKFDIDLKGTTL